ncbi:KilA-N domain-containing protein [Vreelandella aquamarina]|uniref:KilA-N domain-containing protein n=1 Tax=Vreelandella aquamarina TaxID=77097 RepID=A0A857GLB4_9GAMM|nr:KilA-N domain-containing protein [Halomonas meridiana]QHD50059.1 hypothetical protein CTT34_10340 [Halomonas meridiana]
MNSNIATESSQLPVIAGHEITTDEHGRFSLNAIHKASGEGEHKRPSKWTVTAQAKELIEELESQSPKSGFAAIGSKHGGSSRGTYAHELLAVSYAGWISARFQLQVNQVFLDYRMGKLTRVQNDHTPKRIGKTTTQDRAPLKQLVNTIVDARTRRGHPSDYSSAWREINGYLGLESIQDATHEQIELGITFARKVLEGELCSPQAALPDQAESLEIHYPLERWSEINSGLAYAWKHQPPLGCKGRQARFVRPEHVSGDPAHSVSPTLMLLGELVAAGYDVGACRAEVQAMRSMLDDLSSVHSRILEALGRQISYPVIFSH